MARIAVITSNDLRRIEGRRVLIIAGICTLSGVVGIAQQPPTAQRFEVASVKPTRSFESGTIIRQNTGGRFVADNITVSNLIQQAYDLYSFQIVGPDWLERERFDVQAIAPSANTSRAELDALLRQLLEDRFRLRARREKQEGDVYALVIARTDGQLGPNLRPFTGDCTPKDSPCRMRNGPNFTDAVGLPFRILFGQITGNVNRIVVDKTGLTGRFDFKYEWTNDLPTANAIGDRVSFITALQEQLGLRLVNDRAPIDVLVIDSVERPTPD